MLTSLPLSTDAPHLIIAACWPWVPLSSWAGIPCLSPWSSDLLTLGFYQLQPPDCLWGVRALYKLGWCTGRLYIYTAGTLKRTKSIISSRNRSIISILLPTWQIFSPDGFWSLNFICVFLIFMKFNFGSFVIYLKLRTLCQRYMDGK